MRKYSEDKKASKNNNKGDRHGDVAKINELRLGSIVKLMIKKTSKSHTTDLKRGIIIYNTSVFNYNQFYRDLGIQISSAFSDAMSWCTLFYNERFVLL